MNSREAFTDTRLIPVLEASEALESLVSGSVVVPAEIDQTAAASSIGPEDYDLLEGPAPNAPDAPGPLFSAAGKMPQVLGLLALLLVLPNWVRIFPPSTENWILRLDDPVRDLFSEAEAVRIGREEDVIPAALGFLEGRGPFETRADVAAAWKEVTEVFARREMSSHESQQFQKYLNSVSTVSLALWGDEQALRKLPRMDLGGLPDEVRAHARALIAGKEGGGDEARLRRLQGVDRVRFWLEVVTAALAVMLLAAIVSGGKSIPRLGRWSPEETEFGPGQAFLVFLWIEGATVLLLLVAPISSPPALGVTLHAGLTVFLVPAILFRGRGGVMRDHFGLTRSALRRTGVIFLTVLLAVGLNTAFSFAVGIAADRWTHVPHWALGAGGVLQYGSWFTKWSWVGVIAVVGPVAEEILFRGVLFGGLRRELPFVLAAGLSALLFAAIHGNSLVLTIEVFGSGFIWAWVYERTGSLWPNLLAHVLANAAYCASKLV